MAIVCKGRDWPNAPRSHQGGSVGRPWPHVIHILPDPSVVQEIEWGTGFDLYPSSIVGAGSPTWEPLMPPLPGWFWTAYHAYNSVDYPFPWGSWVDVIFEDKYAAWGVSDLPSVSAGLGWSIFEQIPPGWYAGIGAASIVVGNPVLYSDLPADFCVGA